MHPEAYEMLARRQKTYWWHRARRSLALTLLRQHGAPEGCRWIDIGCGPGGNLHLLDDLHPVLTVGVDVSDIALSLAAAAAPSATLVKADINARLPFPDRSFDVATVFNVLYHAWVVSERNVLIEIARIVRPGGLLLLTEPAFDLMRRRLDEIVLTRRRYRRRDFAEWLDAAGFEELFSSYFTSFAVPAVLAAKLLRRRINGSSVAQRSIDTRMLPEIVNRALFHVATLESAVILRGVRMPVGTTLISISRRRVA